MVESRTPEREVGGAIQSIDTGEIPSEWSLENSCPLFKKGGRSFACDYRPWQCP